MAKIKYRNIYTRENLEKHVSPSGSRFAEVEKWRLNDEGEQIRKVVKVEPIYDQIQAARDGVDLHKILERYENGDASALDKVQGMYIDTTELPKTYAEMYKAVQIHNESFDSMPAEIKEKFDNNPAKFWSQFGTEMFDNIINEYRQNVYNNYGMQDPEPVKTAPKVTTEPEIKVGEDNE